MAVNLRIAGDGSGEFSVDSFTQMQRDSNQSWRKEARGPLEPREFAIKPSTTVIRALGWQDLKITLCSNTVREYKLELVVDVVGVGNRWLALPLTARCVVPALRVLNPVMSLGYCLLKFPREEKLTLVNDSDFLAATVFSLRFGLASSSSPQMLLGGVITGIKRFE
ncbi:hydrocephalus-inducing protein homolog [Catharus ustulatus]|uniref:hydrocephalus-inducing protein homolog n=1 Tax=Catharus ustulatus TaxID=91951 RepID=UPI00140E688F|nr:hydrocephalus-inducing protein homolog [Catharus ustulatus]